MNIKELIRKTLQTTIRAGELIFRAYVVLTVLEMYKIVSIIQEQPLNQGTITFLGIIGIMYFLKPITGYLSEVETEKRKDEIMAEIEKEEQKQGGKQK